MAARFRRWGHRSARGVVIPLLRQLPAFLKLLYRLFRDRRVSPWDKALVAAVIAYILTPADLLPDILFPLGFVDDLYLLGLALDRLLAGAGRRVLLDHWEGSPRSLRLLVQELDQIGALLPRPVRRLLRGRLRP
ncbi:MAG: DUF1232 domain-containing protein [Gemmatimonadetes bacterium]|nr:DUF1232 domain-containing protein [Gemmatimonadota bacterium]